MTNNKKDTIAYLTSKIDDLYGIAELLDIDDEMGWEVAQIVDEIIELEDTRRKILAEEYDIYYVNPMD